MPTISEPLLTRSTHAGNGAGVAVAGMLLIASTYGMARFGVGLFAPRLVLERPALAAVVGLAAAAQFVAYSLAAVVAARLVDRRPRTGLVLAGTSATIGCVGVAAASTPVAFGAAVFAGGMGAGFASPAMVRVVDAVSPDRAAPTVQSVVNAGTAVGVIGAGVLANASTSIAPAWVVMATMCAASAAAALALAPRPGGTPAPSTSVAGVAPAPTPGRWRQLVAPGVAAVVAGTGSALIWTFGPLLATRAGPVEADHVGWLWIALGAGGLAGPLTGRIVAGVGLLRAWRLCAAVLAVSQLALLSALWVDAAWVAVSAMAAFGAAYMCLSGVLILWARSAWPGSAGAGTSILFIALAVGQAVGSAGFSTPAQSWPAGALLAATVLCALGGVIPRRTCTDA